MPTKDLFLTESMYIVTLQRTRLVLLNYVNKMFQRGTLNKFVKGIQSEITGAERKLPTRDGHGMMDASGK